jgi:hypothetical protein
MLKFIKGLHFKIIKFSTFHKLLQGIAKRPSGLTQVGGALHLPRATIALEHLHTVSTSHAPACAKPLVVCQPFFCSLLHCYSLYLFFDFF